MFIMFGPATEKNRWLIGDDMNNAMKLLNEVQPSSLSGDVHHAQLRQAFELFNLASKQLSHSHQTIKNRLELLQDQYAEIEEKSRREQADKSELENQFNNLLQVLPVGVVVLGRTGKVRQCNRSAVELLGEPLEGEKWVDVIKRSFSPKADDGHEVSLKDGRMVGVSTCSLDHGDGQMIVLTDLTQTRRLQSRIEKNRRVWELGKMSAALAHQIRTPLSSAMLYASQMKNYALDEGQRDAMCDRILQSLQHLESQIKDVLSFVRPQTDSWSSVSVGSLMKGVELSLSSLLLTKKATLNIEVEEDLDAIHCHRDVLQGALVNLIQNGIESVESITDVDGVSDQAKRVIAHVTVLCKKVNGSTVISISDNGPGIAKQAQKKIFDPFFSTKQNGTGLGLAVVKEVMDAHGVDIEIESKKGRGTEFTLLF